MKNEHDREQKWGKSWISSFVVSAIDQTLGSKNVGNQEATGGHCVNLIDLILTPLVIEKIPVETLEHLKLEFVAPVGKKEMTEEISKDLYHIKEVLTTEFGDEVVRRLKLSIVEEKVRNFPVS